MSDPVQGPELPVSPGFSYKRVLLIAGIAIVVSLLAVAGYFGYRATHPPAHPPKVVNPQTAFNQGDVTGSLAQIDEILAKNSKDVNALIQKSLMLAQQGSLTFKEVELGGQAVLIANQAIALSPKSSDAYRALGYANEIQQKYTEAHSAYQKAIELDSKNAQAVYGDAHAYDLQGDVVKAEEGYKKALAIDSKLYNAYLGIGRAENAKGNKDAAIDAFTQVYNYDQNQHDKSEAAYSIGMLLLSKGIDQANLARGYFEKAIEFDKTYPSAHLGEGTVLYIQALAKNGVSADTRAKLLFGSVAALQEAIKLNPNQSLAYFQLAESLFALDQKDAAQGALSSATKAVPYDITLSATEKQATLANIATFSATLNKKSP